MVVNVYIDRNCNKIDNGILSTLVDEGTIHHSGDIVYINDVSYIVAKVVIRDHIDYSTNVYLVFLIAKKDSDEIPVVELDRLDIEQVDS